MILGILKESFDGENRVAIVPATISILIKLGLEVQVQSGAGAAAGFTDEAYTQRGAKIVGDRRSVLQQADVVAQVRCYGANPRNGEADLDAFKSGQIVIGFTEPLTAHEQNKAMAGRGVTLMSMELIPRITRAQSMDALSSQANLAGYYSVLIATMHLPKIFPMMMTAAGTLKAAKVFIVGAGVAGLQAIATAKRLGAIVSAIDVRPEVKEQVESLGAKFVIPPVEAKGEGGYAKELTEEQKSQQRQMMSDTVAESDVVITTALIPGRPAPKLLTEEMVKRMAPRSVVVDIAAERGGNCEITEPGKTAVKHGVTIIGKTNIASEVAYDASTMYSNNVSKLLAHLAGKEGKFELKMEDEITSAVVVCKDGQMVNARVKQAMGAST